MRRNNPAGLCLLSWLLVNAATATAAGSDPLPPNVTLGELESAQAQNLLLEQKVQTARLQQQLRESLTAVTSAPALGGGCHRSHLTLQPFRCLFPRHRRKIPAAQLRLSQPLSDWSKSMEVPESSAPVCSCPAEASRRWLKATRSPARQSA